VNPAQRNRTLALVRAGFEDGPALTVASTDGEIPHGRELSFAWLTGTVMTGLTSVLLMGAALYVSFKGQDTFSTAYEALQVVARDVADSAGIISKTSRIRPTTVARSELEIVEASIRESVNGRDIIRKQPFVRVRATLATAATAISDDIPPYDPQALIDSSQPIIAPADTNTSIYGAEVEGEVSIRTAPLPSTLMPARLITEAAAESYVRETLENFFGEGGSESADSGSAQAYLPSPGSIRDLGVVDSSLGVAENVTLIPKTTTSEDAGPGRLERLVTVKETSRLEDVLRKNGFTDPAIKAVSHTLNNVYPSTTLAPKTRLRILFNAAETEAALIPYRLSIYVPDETNDRHSHAATVARTDRGGYVLGLAPSEIAFPEEDTEEVNVSNLPSVYRAIWETARKHEISDDVAKRIVAMFAYDVDLTRKITPGDTIEILQTEKNAEGQQELLYVGLKLGTTMRQLYRYRALDGTVDFYDPNGETGKRFLTRRPLQGGGRLASRFGYRIHPIFKSRRLHTGVDFAAPRGTPIYAGGDGVIERAGWVSGYGRYVEIRHVNGFETAYGHMNAIADGMKPGATVRQGQVIGYVGSTGNSTGNHLHYEIKVNGRFVDPLSVKLPRDNSLPAQETAAFKQTIAQINDLMSREAAPVQVAAVAPGSNG
jgi:murein DD-endopeptidase MepM/ murein hydrolase activator NlpD